MPRKGRRLISSCMHAQVLRSELDGVVNVYNEKGSRVGGNDDSGGPDSFLEYKIPADGMYHVGISDHLRGGGPGYAYRLEVRLSEPELTLTLPDRRRYEATQINVPQGNRAAVMINAVRRGVGGAIDISGLNLPEGVTVTPIQMPADRTTVPLLLTAAPAAKLDGRLVNFVGTIADNPIEVEIHSEASVIDWPEQQRRVRLQRRSCGGGRHRGRPMHHRNRSTSSPDRAGWLDGPGGESRPG